ncbi:MAG: hypothetical protein PHT15_08370 [Gallionellaceae bacterium]|nr:hypothetical protein [Gallionellaceae bacterium]
MKKICFTLCMSSLAVFAAPQVFAVDATAVMAGAIGGGAGAAIGQSVGGQSGAVVGGALGGALGVVLSAPDPVPVVAQPVRVEYTVPVEHEDHRRERNRERGNEHSRRGD